MSESAKNAIHTGANFVRRLIELGDEFDMRLTPAACAAFYAQNLQGVILRDLHSNYAEVWSKHPESRPIGKKAKLR